MLGMIGIGKDLEEFLIAAAAPDILGRGRAGAVDTGRIGRIGIGRDERLHHDPMPPVIAEVIDIEEGRRLEAEVAKSHHALRQQA